jgi:putative membrane protein
MNHEHHHHHHASIRDDYFSTRKLIFNWKLVLLRILVNGAAIAIAALFLPGLVIPKEHLIINLLVLGLVFGLLNAFIKPFVQVLTISLIFVTYGLVVIIINTIMLFLLNFLVSDTLQVNSLFAGIMGGIIISLLSLVFDNIFGLTPPIVDDETFEKLAHDLPAQGIGFMPAAPEVEMDEDPLIISPLPVRTQVEIQTQENEIGETADSPTEASPDESESNTEKTQS